MPGAARFTGMVRSALPPARLSGVVRSKSPFMAAEVSGIVMSGLPAAVRSGWVISGFAGAGGKPGMPLDMGGRTPVGPPLSGGIV
ncbi:hypothetical protein Acy02nite_64800 [Actinoplanes cyaneus]|uniref:Uncharacterized protein n=1 Tax=Actinoplanes cyaneus TaxID=52696 RepID=A0A919MAH8_9ACTN|nr:hypothetical protein Acy02nite_64800 [Actinoplanes cyaneus]